MKPMRTCPAALLHLRCHSMTSAGLPEITAAFGLVEHDLLPSPAAIDDPHLVAGF
jgi:hypothetical protein